MNQIADNLQTNIAIALDNAINEQGLDPRKAAEILADALVSNIHASWRMPEYNDGDPNTTVFGRFVQDCLDETHDAIDRLVGIKD